MPDSLTFSIQPKGDALSLDLFLRAMYDIQKLILDVDYAVTRERLTKRRWVISQLHSSVPTVSVRSIIGDNETVTIVSKGLRHVTLGSNEPPEFFTEEALEHLIRMRKLFVGPDRVNAIVVSVDSQETATIREDIESKTSMILSGGYWNLGSIEGNLEALNLHGTHTFTVWDRVSKAPVRCTFPREKTWTEQVKQLLETRVIVRGKIRYFGNGRPRSVTNIEAIENATPDTKLPRADFGSIPDSRAARDPALLLDEIWRRKG